MYVKYTPIVSCLRRFVHTADGAVLDKCYTIGGKLNVSGEEDGLFISKDNTSVLFSKNVDANIYDKSEETNKYCLDLRSLIIYRK